MGHRRLIRRSAELLVSCILVFSTLFIEPVAASSVVPLGSINTVDTGKRVTVDGTIIGTARYQNGFKLYLADGTGQVALVLRQDRYEQILSQDRSNLQIGATVHATGKINVDQIKVDRGDGRGEVPIAELQVVPSLGNDVWVLTPTTTVFRKYQLGMITGNDHNAIVLVEGTVTDIQPSTTGAYFLVSDSTGSQNVRVDSVVSADIPNRDMLRLGQEVRIIGRVRAAQKRGTIIEVQLPTDIQVVAPSPASG